MGFSTNYENVNDDYSLIPEGKYEVVIRNIEERTTKNGATGINLSLVIRNDVEQAHKNRYLFHTLWKRKDPTDADKQVQGYSFAQIMRLAKSAKLPSGKAYETIKDLCEDLLKRPIQVTVEHDTYQGNTREIIKYINESAHPECRHTFTEKGTAKTDSNTFAAPPVGSIANEFEEILADGKVPF